MKTTTESIAWWTPFVGDREKELVLEVLSSQYLNEGEYVERFEKSIAKLLGVPYAVATTSGTAAIFLALKAFGVGPGDEVIVPDITFIATANAVRLTGATPVLVDVEEATLNISPAAVERAITSKTKAIIPVHVSGRSAKLEELKKIAEKKGLVIVEDAAEALGGKYKDKSLGTWGGAGCFSFSANKTVTTGQGGIVVTSNPKIHEALRELKDHGRPVRGTGGDDTHHSIGFNFKMTNLQAAVGLGQLERLVARELKMQGIYQHYAEALSQVEDLSFFGFTSQEVPQWTDARYTNRNGLVNHLKTEGIHCRNFWHPLHTQKSYEAADKLFPVSTEVGYESFWLPSSFLMTEEQQEKVCSLVIEFSQKTSRRAA